MSSSYRRLVHLFLSFDQQIDLTEENPSQRAKLALRTFLLYIFYIINILILAILSQSSNHFLISNALEYHLIQMPFLVKSESPTKGKSRIDFHQISTLNDIWLFIRTVMGPVFYPRVDQGKTILEHFLLIGVIRMRQIRVKSQWCSIADQIDQCYPSYSSERKATETFAPINSDINLKQAWSYMSSNLTGMDSFTGQFARYDADGYVVDLGEYNRTYERVYQDLNELENFHWLDKATRVLFLDLITFNPSVNLFSSIKLIFEMPSTGGIFPSYTIEHRQLIRNVSSMEYLRYTCEVIVLIFTVFFVLLEVVKFLHLKCRLFLYVWNWIDLVHIIVSISMIVVYISRLFLLRSDRLSLNKLTFDLFAVKLFRRQALLDHLQAILTSISIIRLLKYCDFSANLVRIKATIQRCFGDLIGFLLMFVAIMIAYAQFGNLTLGQHAPAFSTLGKAFVALFRTVLSDFDYDAISDASPIIGPLFFFLYIFSMVFMLFNMVLAIIVDSYAELGDEHRDVLHRMLIDVTPLLKDSIRIVLEKVRLKVIVQMIISADEPSESQSIADLLQSLKYSSLLTSALYDDLRQTFLHDLNKRISKKDFDAFLRYAQEDQIRQRETLQNLFNEQRSKQTESNEEDEWNEKIRNLCTIQQWAHIRYRMARLDELCQSVQSKMTFIVRTTDNFFTR